MSTQDRCQRRADAATEFDRHDHRDDGTRVANLLADGLSMLRDLLFTRIHGDMETQFGLDSMLLPMSLLKSEANTKTEIEIYQIAESTADAAANRYAGGDEAWYLNWLARLRLGDAVGSPGIVQRLASYRGRSGDERRRIFSSQLQRVHPEAGRAPLVMFRLLPLAVSIATAIAFGDTRRAEEVRKRQVTWLPSIADCHACHGRLMDVAEECPQCGNPIWKYNWLTAD
ncbi:MAG TPA: hypothetical protein VHX65_17885 [Pirellulales bacterium]|jgi:hypothetical protein|nr:hypothetical protein [Pirellulales bacterium]